MDNNVLSLDHGLRQIEIAAEKGYYLDFNQGLDSRLITDDVAALLARCKWLKYIRSACDSSAQIPYIKRAVALLRKHGYKKEIFVYCLLKDFDETYARVRELWEMRGVAMFCQPYRDFTPGSHQVIPQWQIDMARWADRKWFCRTMWVDDFSPRKGFLFGMYKNKDYRLSVGQKEEHDLFTI